MPDHTITVPCPHVMDDGAPCEADVVVTLHWCPGEMWGTDADGNRGMWVPGHYEVDAIGEACEAGCVFAEADSEALEKAAEQAAVDYEPWIPEPADDY